MFEVGQAGVLEFLDLMAGGTFSNFSIFALNIYPYVTSSIIIQLLTIAIPRLEEIAKEGEEGRKKMAQWTKYGALILAAIQSIAMTKGFFQQAVVAEGFLQNTIIIVSLIAGTSFLIWLGDLITDRGIGNGISLIIMIGIIAQLPFALFAELISRLEEGGGLVMLLVEIVVLFFVFEGAILLVQGTRRVPVQYAKRIVGNKQYGGVRQYIPLKVNAAGVMPIIFAQAIMFIPITLAGFVDSESATGFAATFSDFTGFWYNFVFASLIILFTYFYTAITVNPTQMADDMKRNGGFIPGVKPGKKTAEFLDSVMSKITLPGSVFLALVAILPAFAMMAGIDQNFAQFYGGTSLLILVGVVLDTLQQIESHLLMRHYDGLLKSGRIKGRTGGGASAY